MRAGAEGLGVSDAAVRRAAATLRRGGLVAFPTETVYGLGCHALDAHAVRRVFDVKGRPADNPLIVHLSDGAALAEIVTQVTPLARDLARTYWPGPLTLVLEARPDVPSVTRGGLTTVAVRVPAHPVALALLEAAGVPTAAPSANRSGRPSPTTADDVRAELGDAVDDVLDGGPCRLGLESTVVDARGDRPVVLREGMVTREELGLALDDGVDPSMAAASPGTRYRHYAPGCAVKVADPGGGPELAASLAAVGTRVGLVAPGPPPPGVVPIARFTGPADLGTRLYRSLRDAERAQLDVLVVEGVPAHGPGRAVMDRLRRAAGGAPGTSPPPAGP